MFRPLRYRNIQIKTFNTFRNDLAGTVARKGASLVANWQKMHAHDKVLCLDLELA